MQQAKQSPSIVSANQGETLSIAGGSYRIIISGAQTNGEYATIEMTVPPGGGPGPHAHAGFHETFFVLEGEIEIRTEEGRYTATTGSYAAIPKGGIVHGFKNKSGQVARLLCTVIPAGLDSFFKEMAALTAPQAGKENQAPDLGRVKEVAEKYGQKIYPPDYLD